MWPLTTSFTEVICKVTGFYSEHIQVSSQLLYFVLFYLDIPMSIGVIDIKTNPSQLNAVEFLWDPAKRTSAFIQV